MSEVKTNKITSLASNNDITLDPDGTGDVVVASGHKLGVGTTSPARQLEVYDDGTNGQAVLALTAQNTENSRIMFADPDDNNIGILDYNHSDDSMRFVVNNSERMRLSSAGDFQVGQNGTVNTSGTNSGVNISAQYGTFQANFHGNDYPVVNIHTSGANNRFFNFRFGNSSVGNITTNGSTTSYSTSSDHRLKENVDDMTGAIARVKQLAPKRFNFIADADTTVDGFLAHEAQAVVPEAVGRAHV